MKTGPNGKQVPLGRGMHASVNLVTGACAVGVYRAWLYARIEAGDNQVRMAFNSITPETTLVCAGCVPGGCHSEIIVRAWEYLRQSGDIEAPGVAHEDIARVVHVQRSKFDVFIGPDNAGNVPPAPQEGCFGNPFSRSPIEDRVELYRAYFVDRLRTEPAFRAAVLALRGQRLGCFCKPAPCHGDVIAEWLNSDAAA